MTQRRPCALIYIGASLPQVAGIRAVRDAGIYTAVTDISPDAPGRRVANQFAVISATDLQAQVAQARKLAQSHDVVGCYGVADFASPAIAAIYEAKPFVASERMAAAASAQKGLPPALKIAADKAAAKTCWRREALPAPCQYWQSGNIDAVKDAEAVQKAIPATAILKPMNANNSRGVSLIEKSDLSGIISALHSASLNGQGVVVEEYCRGQLINVDGLMIAGNMHMVSITDRTNMSDASFQPAAGVRPTRLVADKAEYLYAIAGRAARAIGLENGPFTIDMVLTADGPRLLEITPNFHTVFSEMLAGNEWALHAWLAYLSGDEAWPSLIQTPSEKSVGYVQLYATRPGVISAVHGHDDLACDPNFVGLYELRGVGDKVSGVTGTFADVCGVVWMATRDRVTLDLAIDRARQTLVFETTPP